MTLLEIFLIAVGLSMDAFAVSICKGLAVKSVKPKHAVCVGIYFGGFQLLMPLLGYLLGTGLSAIISSVAPWVAFILLAFIGGNMIREAVSGEEEEANDSFSVKTMLPLAVATSIDALATGVAFAAMEVRILPALILIGCTTFVISAVGLYIGYFFGSRYQKKAEIFGGLVLIGIGLKILLERLFT
ncbi:MAG: manganese efflux pump [Clostridia bacterium]|nr:manganese efflux pump [Clostridia bacterium]